MQEFNGEQYRENVKAAIERFYKERAQEGKPPQYVRHIIRQKRREFSCNGPATRGQFAGVRGSIAEHR